jgi:uncharacterized protein DUF2809
LSVATTRYYHRGVRYSSRAIRLVLVALVAGFVGLALGIRLAMGGALDSAGRLQQDTGTALYAAVAYLAVVFVRPRINPYAAGAAALAFCWLIEAAQLTPVPASISAHSLALRLLVGAHFDWLDVAWYPVGIAPLVIADRLSNLRGRARRPSPASLSTEDASPAGR